MVDSVKRSAEVQQYKYYVLMHIQRSQNVVLNAHNRDFDTVCPAVGTLIWSDGGRHSDMVRR